MQTEATITPVKLTKKALNDFIVWSSSRYNDYCNYGTKTENVNIVFNSLKAGCYVDCHGRKDESKTAFIVQCAGSVGETWNGRSFRYWKTKQGGKIYHVDTVNKTIREQYSGREIKFL